MIGDWLEEYKRKFVSAEEAVKMIKSGNRVAFTHGREPLALGLALAAHKQQVKDVRIFLPNPYTDFGWYNAECEDSFKIETSYVLPLVKEVYSAHHCDFIIGGLTGIPPEHPVISDVDVLFTEVSPPDEHGFCSFGASVWGKRKAIQQASTTIAEVNKDLIRTYGANFVHVSEIDCFVEHIYCEEFTGESDLLGREVGEPVEMERRIAEYVNDIVEDGDTLQIGIGSTSEWLVPLGVLDRKVDLGWHSEITSRGVIRLVRDGVINSKYKNCHRGKAIAVAIGGGNKEDMAFVNNNPMFELYDAEYVLDPRVIARNDKVLAINSALSIDLTGQIGAESIGPIMIGGPGGQLAFAIGAQFSKGGRFVSVLPSTARGGTVSRIVPLLAEGTVVTVPRTLTDIVVTEYGIAHLRNKSQRERALELITIAHPDFRGKLKREAEKLYWS
ncbi:acetyl-CoA hydrolase/transferase family protein [Chloroflexota bacterium]